MFGIIFILLGAVLVLITFVLVIVFLAKGASKIDSKNFAIAILGCIAMSLLFFLLGEKLL